jgi:predicted alpha/beta superfamily hydrolase
MQAPRAIAVVAALAGCGATSREPGRLDAPQTAHAVLGDTLTIDSKILGQQRVINVYVPPGYATSQDRYPVLYMPDGGMAEDFPHVVGSVDVSIKNAIIRPLIVVGIENIDRRHDLASQSVLAEEQKLAPNAGGTEQFRAFLRDELRPFIAARYRTNDETALIGESLAGLFVIETFLLEPTLFDSYIAADPSVWWNEQATVGEANVRLAWWTAGKRFLYFATAETQPGIDVLKTALRIQAPEGVTWIHDPMPDATHATIFPTAALHGIRAAFARPGED